MTTPFRVSALPGDPGAGSAGECLLECGGERVGKRGIRRDTPTDRVLVVLRLGDEVGGDPGGARGGVGDDEHLGRPGDHVDPHFPNDLPFRLGDPAIAGAHDLVHPRDRGGAIGQRRDCLRTADP